MVDFWIIERKSAGVVIDVCPTDVRALRAHRARGPFQSICLCQQAGMVIPLCILSHLVTESVPITCKGEHPAALQAIKYGVLSTSALVRDLWMWNDFYIAGRLHKPVLFLARDAVIDRAVTANLEAALASALLLLPARFTSQVLLCCPYTCACAGELSS